MYASKFEKRYLKLQARPGLSQVGMSSVCRTLSLATLQNVFPGAKHWRQRTPNRTLPTEQSPYVIEFIGNMASYSLQSRGDH